MRLQEFDIAEGEGLTWLTESGTYLVALMEVYDDEVILMVDGPDDMTVTMDGAPRYLSGVPRCKGLPRAWLLFAFVLSASTRRRVFFPVFNEFLEDYMLARRTYRGKWARRWLAVAFAIRTAAMVKTCFRIQVCHSIASLLQWLRKFLGKETIEEKALRLSFEERTHARDEKQR